MSTVSMDAEQRMREMMRELRVDVLELCYDKVGATFETARGACAQCASVDACLEWLESNPSGWAPEFCPNHELFGRFKAS